MKFALGDSFRRLHRLGRERRRLLARATGAVTCSSVAVALLPFKWAVAYGAVPLGLRQKRAAVKDCVWAVETAGKRLPWRTLCFENGIAVQRLLRKSGVDAVLHYGARHEPGTGKLQAHVWVTVGERDVIGGEDAEGYSELAAFP